jgi:hypothetical protein
MHTGVTEVVAEFAAFLPPDQLPRPPYNQLPDMSLNP